VKIVRLVYDWPPPWHGLAPHPYEVTVSQLKLGHEVHVFCGRWPKSGPLQRPEGSFIYPIWREPFVGTSKVTSSVILFFKYFLWRRKNKDVDIIHAHGHFGIWIYVYRLLLQKLFPWSKELKIPLVAHFHNTAKGRWEKLKEKGNYIMPHSKYFSWPLEVFSDRILMKVSSAQIFVSEDTKKEAQKYYGGGVRRSFVVESGVNLNLFQKVGDEERSKTKSDLGFDMYDRVILAHGIMTERKNIHLLVEALSFLPSEYKLLLVGPWDSSYSEKVNEIIAKKHLDHRIVKVGYTPYPQVPIAFHAADLLVTPSSWEGLPKVVMQGLAVGIPCVVSGFKLKDKMDGIFYLSKLDPKSIAKDIQKVSSEKRSVDSSQIQGYSWDHKVKEIEKIYEFAKKNYLV